MLINNTLESITKIKENVQKGTFSGRETSITCWQLHRSLNSKKIYSVLESGWHPRIPEAA